MRESDPHGGGASFPLHIVLTNDDGYDAPGLAALHRLVRRVAPTATIQVIAPAEAYSGKGHAVSPEVRCRRASLPEIGEVIVVDGTPADCARVAIALPGLRRPDWVISGINRGGNLGVDVFYSGTVAAAREAAILGIRAMAVSQMIRSNLELDWDEAIRMATPAIACLLEDPHTTPPALPNDPASRRLRACTAELLAEPPTTHPGFWNINLPHCPPDAPCDRIARTRVSCDPLHLAYKHRREPDGSDVLVYGGRYLERPVSPGTDVEAVFGGAISLSWVTVA